MTGGTEAFPDLGKHCEFIDCKQLDFLPFTCDGCRKVFCLDHRSYGSHECQKEHVKSRKVAVCEICSISIETTGRNEKETSELMEEHVKSKDCDARNKKKATCSVKRCKEVLTFSNTYTCKTCHTKVCMNHRFEALHDCKNITLLKPKLNGKFLDAFSLRPSTSASQRIPVH